ncbi:hypothetical protein SAMN05661096_00680 [Marivirga sericea]|uniref:Uncharacterized protein n=1 Tax=Marivirga sericea TaxID=1028 RepID=A0A1X7IJC6_9BACT|nr:hypothetical protein [Marivirga sericea]SMG14487.1 hypothetical protein SAMN05661096_00680 [Marivirga sericea]
MNSFSENVAFENSLVLWHLLLLIGLWILGIYWEFQKRKPRKGARIIALSLVLISLYVIYLSPYTLTEKPLKSALIINRDIPDSIIDSLKLIYEVSILKQNQKGRFELGETGKESSINELDFQLDTVFVYGYVPHLNPEYYKIRKDIVMEKGLKLHYPKSIAFGDSLKIGIQNLNSRDTRISATIGQDTVSKFLPKEGKIDLSILPKFNGALLSKISTDDANYHFAVSVEKPEKYIMQILSASPDFEWKFFVDFLKSKEHSVYQKTQISKDKFKSAFVNWHDSLQINRGVANDLKVLFTDAKAWEDLSSNAKRDFLKKLESNDGSLIFRTSPNSQIQLDLDKSKSTNIFSTSDNLLESNDYNYLQFNNLRDLDEVAQNAVFRKVLPELIVGVINFQSSFQLKLSGKDKEYAQLWSPIFNDLIRKSGDEFYDKTEWPVQFQPFFFRLWAEAKRENILVITPTSDTIYLASKVDYLFAGRQHFMFYPKQEGWHFVQLKNQEAPIPFYVHPEDEIRQSEFLLNYNYDYLKYLNFAKSVIQQEKRSFNRKSVTIWFFILFIIGVTYLWIEDKIT